MEYQYKDYDLEGRVAVITGANSGIGREAAIQFAKCGSKVVGAARRKENLDAVVKEVEALGGEMIAVPTNVGDAEQAGAVAKAAVDRFGKIDILLNNAGLDVDIKMDITNRDLITTIPAEEYLRVLQINLVGHYNMICACLPAMRENGFGRVVGISSVTGFNGIVGSPPYVTSKAGIFVQTKSFAINYAKENILFNSIAPGMVNTPMHANTPKEEFEWSKRITPMDRIAEPIDIVRVVLFLAQNHLFMTGEMLIVDGGVNMN